MVGAIGPIVGQHPLDPLRPEQTAGPDALRREQIADHRVEVFGKPAQVVRDYLSKGRQVYVEGSIRYDEWTDKDGNKRNTTKIHVGGPNSKVVLLGSRGEGGGGGPRGGGGAQGQAPPSDDFQASDDDVPF